MHAMLLLLAALTATAVTGSAGAFGEAPYGLSWGPLTSIPKPSLANREDNVTLLMYRNDRLPSGAVDTEELVLEVCEKEGLQQIVWISRLFSDAEFDDKLQAILREGNRRYGIPETRDRGVIAWNSGRFLMLRTRADPGMQRIIMVSHGPEFDACSIEHERLSGHSIDNHWIRFLVAPGSN